MGYFRIRPELSVFKLKFFENVYNSICPYYTIDEESLSNWSSFLGEYEVWQQHYSIYTVAEIPDYVQLQIEEGVLRFSWNNFILTPLSQTQLIILGDPFDGELMYRDTETGDIFWQNRVFKPLND